MDSAIDTTMVWLMYNDVQRWWGQCTMMYNNSAIDTLMARTMYNNVQLWRGQRCTRMDSAIDTGIQAEEEGGREGGNERQTTKRRCLNPPTAIRAGLNTAPPHISKGRGRYKGWLCFRKPATRLCQLCLEDGRRRDRNANTNTIFLSQTQIQTQFR